MVWMGFPRAQAIEYFTRFFFLLNVFVWVFVCRARIAALHILQKIGNKKKWARRKKKRKEGKIKVKGEREALWKCSHNKTREKSHGT